MNVLLQIMLIILVVECHIFIYNRDRNIDVNIMPQLFSKIMMCKQTKALNLTLSVQNYPQWFVNLPAHQALSLSISACNLFYYSLLTTICFTPSTPTPRANFLANSTNLFSYIIIMFIGD